jgi:hypothetical protein
VSILYKRQKHTHTHTYYMDRLNRPNAVGLRGRGHWAADELLRRYDVCARRHLERLSFLFFFLIHLHAHIIWCITYKTLNRRDTQRDTNEHNNDNVNDKLLRVRSYFFRRDAVQSRWFPSKPTCVVQTAAKLICTYGKVYKIRCTR